MERQNVTGDIASVVRDAMTSILEKISVGQYGAPDLAVLLKLIQIEKEIKVEGPKQVSVQWVETWESNYLNDE